MIVSIIIICLGLFGSAFISATEVAFVGSRVYRIRHLSNNGNRNASLVLKIIEKRGRDTFFAQGCIQSHPPKEADVAHKKQGFSGL